MRPLEFGFRRRCAWCGVTLRAWQLNQCRHCKLINTYGVGPWCVQGSRWDEQADERRRWQ